MRHKLHYCAATGQSRGVFKPSLVVFLQHLGGRPFFPCVRKTMNGAHGALLSLDGAPCGWGFKVPAHSRGTPRHEHRNRLHPAPDGGRRGRGIGLGPAAARRSATSACAPTWPGTGARPRAREFLPQLWLAVTLSPPPLGRGGLQDGRRRAWHGPGPRCGAC